MMMSHAKVILFTVLALAGNAAWADEMGRSDYMDGCAGCHGESGMGQGPLAGLLNIAVPDLTHLSARNDGEFPMLDVIHTIDGRTGLAAHGGPMPIWGTIFKSHALGESAMFGGAEAITRGRILSIAYYLESIQQ
jgi:hypothetical protein